MNEQIISKSKYPIEINNVGDDVYIVMSKGHHCPHEFMKAVREDYSWPLGMPVHKWIRTVPAPKNSSYSHFYAEAVPGSRGSFPATYAYEAYGDDRYEALVAKSDNSKETK